MKYGQEVVQGVARGITERVVEMPRLPAYVYQGNGAAYVDFPLLWSAPANAQVDVEVLVYVISHTNAVRGIVAAAEGFTGPVNETNWTLTLHSDNRARFRHHDFDGPTIVSVSSDVVPAGRWVKIVAGYDPITFEAFISLDDGLQSRVPVGSAGIYTPTPSIWLMGTAGVGGDGVRADQMQLSSLQVAMGGFTYMDCSLDEGSGLVCVNSAFDGEADNGVISDEAIHAPTLDRWAYPG